MWNSICFSRTGPRLVSEKVCFPSAPKKIYRGLFLDPFVSRNRGGVAHVIWSVRNRIGSGTRSSKSHVEFNLFLEDRTAACFPDGLFPVGAKKNLPRFVSGASC